MESTSRLFFCVIFIYFGYGVLGQVATVCRPNERFLFCGSCQKTCKDPAPECTGVCRTGCFCNDNEVRNETGHCVKLADCPVASSSGLHTTEPRSTDTTCPEDEEYRHCEPCNKTCDNPNPVCPAQCARGCFCKEGLLKDVTGKCVWPENCSKEQARKNNTSIHTKPIPVQMTCGPHQVYSDCRKCEKTCSSASRVCRDICSAGCFCEEGFLRAPSGQCVKIQDCPKAEVTMGGAHEPSVEDCSPDEVYLSCGWCEPSCWEPAPECPLGVCTRGCLCRPPLLRHHGGDCVEEKLCVPQKCQDSNEEFVCRYGCEGRCDARKCATRARRCVLGCYCKLGYLRDSTGRCVNPDKCSTLPIPIKNRFKVLESMPIRITSISKPKFYIDVPEMKDFVVPKLKFEDVPEEKEISITKSNLANAYIPKLSVMPNLKHQDAMPKSDYEDTNSASNFLNKDFIAKSISFFKGLYKNEEDSDAEHKKNNEELITATKGEKLEETNFNTTKKSDMFLFKDVANSKTPKGNDFMRILQDLLPSPINFTILNYPLWLN